MRDGKFISDFDSFTWDVLCLGVMGCGVVWLSLIRLYHCTAKEEKGKEAGVEVVVDI